MAKLPTVTSNIPRDLRTFVDRVREALSDGTPDGVVTARQLVAAGIATYVGGNLTGTVGAGVTPSRPSNVAASGALANIMVTWDKPVYEGHAFAEIWAAARTQEQEDADPPEDPTIGQAELVGMAPGTFFAHNIGAGGTRWYWVRFVNFAGTAGAYQSTEGIEGSTGQSPALLLDLLSGELTESQLSSTLSARIDLIDGASTVAGSVNARVADVQQQVNELLNLPEWSSTETYAIDDQIVHEGSLYVALAASTNVEPGTDDTKWDEIGEYATIGDAVAAHTTQISNLENDLGTEVSDRTALATRLIGDYDEDTNPDVNALTQGLLYQERVARSTADGSIAQDVTDLTALTNLKNRTFFQSNEPASDDDYTLKVGDMWVDTDQTLAEDYVEGDYSIRSNRIYRWDGDDWVEAMDYGFADFFSAMRTEKTARVTEDEALSSRIDTLTSATNGNISTINATLSTHTTDISTNANAITTLTSTVNGNYTTLNSAIQTEASTRATADSTNANAITTLQSTVNTNNQTLTAAIAAEAATRADETGDLFGQYTVKIDLNGYVSGYGLASSVVDGTPTSEFIIRSDSFAIGRPTEEGTNVEPDYPFIVRQQQTTINGETVPVGVYMRDAFIQNGTITNAKIGDAAIDNAKIANIDAGKITTGFLDSNRIDAGSITANQIDSRGLSIKDADGNIILAAGNPLAVENIQGLGDLARFSAITVSNITDAGTLATLDEVTEDNLSSGLAGTIDGKIENWFQTSDPSTAWTNNDIRTKHLGDMWWKTDEEELYRYAYIDGQYQWSEMTSQTAKDAFANASTAQDTADRKRQVFVSQPTPPYDVGDLWDRGATTGIWRCATAKTATQNYAGGDWQVVADKTGSNEAASISNQGNFATLDQVTADNISTYIANGAIGNAYIGNVIQSGNYSAGSAGWKIDKEGEMEMNNATFRGTLDVGGTSGNRLVITSDKIEVWEGTTLRVRLGNLG